MASVVTASLVILGLMARIHKWFLKQEHQDEEIAQIKAEQRVLVTGVLATLDGLEQLGCNHSVPKAKSLLENHLNDLAHK